MIFDKIKDSICNYSLEIFKLDKTKEDEEKTYDEMIKDASDSIIEEVKLIRKRDLETILDILSIELMDIIAETITNNFYTKNNNLNIDSIDDYRNGLITATHIIDNYRKEVSEKGVNYNKEIVYENKENY